jgi:hypothetical protein
MDLPSAIETPATHLELGTDRPGASGWIYCALSEKDRCRVRRVHGLDRIPSSVVFYDTPDIGQLLNHELGLAVASGRFILTGASTAFVKRDLRVISDAYSIDVEPDTP